MQKSIVRSNSAHDAFFIINYRDPDIGFSRYWHIVNVEARKFILQRQDDSGHEEVSPHRGISRGLYRSHFRDGRRIASKFLLLLIEETPWCTTIPVLWAETGTAISPDFNY